MSSPPSILDCAQPPRAVQEHLDCITPQEAFAIIANETRLSILDTLWRGPDEPVTFSELQDMMGMSNSSRFNYHLQQLEGAFIAKTDAGYILRTAGERLVHAILAGSFTQHPHVDSFHIGDNCHDCGAALQLQYADERLALTCSDCHRLYGEQTFAPSGLTGRSKADIADAFDQSLRHRYSLALHGVCPECDGQTNVLIRDGDPTSGGAVNVDIRCEQCHEELNAPVWLGILSKPKVISFYQDHGIDLDAERYWTFGGSETGTNVTVVSTEPWEIIVSISLDGETLRLTVDGALEIQEIERISCDVLPDASANAD